jgi:excisionase family DNA binding protein
MAARPNNLRRERKIAPSIVTTRLGKLSPRAGRDAYLTPTEVADRLLVAPVTVRLWASKGLMPSVTTLGGHRRFRIEDVDAFVRRHQTLDTGEDEAPARILIIDDDDQYARYLAKIISARIKGVEVDIANDGFSAGLKCASTLPDVITLDLQMPDMDGFEVCSRLRLMFGKSKPRIVALTGFASARNRKRVIAAGANVCLAKTSSEAVLLREIGLGHAIKA